VRLWTIELQREVITMTIKLPTDIEKRIKDQAALWGLSPDEYVVRFFKDHLPPPKSEDSLREMFAQWEAEDYTDDPEEIARREQELDEFKQAMNRNRLEMDGPNARTPFP
jgi:hypothetical protein